jgi:hypothetical protein
LWETGLLLTVEHLRASENYSEDLAAGGHFFARYGAARGPLDRDWNAADCIEPTGIGPHPERPSAVLISFEIKNWCAITPGGHLLVVDRLPGTVEVSAETADKKTTVTVFAVRTPERPKELDRAGGAVVRHCGPGFKLTITPTESDDSLAVCRINLTGRDTRPTRDEAFLAPAAHLGGSQALAAATSALRRDLLSTAERARKYYKEFAEADEPWALELLRHLLSVLTRIASEARQPHPTPGAFFARTADALDALRLDADVLLPWPDSLTNALDRFLEDDARNSARPADDLGPVVRSLQNVAKKLDTWVRNRLGGEPAPAPAGAPPPEPLREGFTVTDVRHGRYADSVYWEVEIEFENSLREEFGRDTECRILFEAAGDESFDKSVVRFPTPKTPEPGATKRKATLAAARAPRARPGWYEFPYTPLAGEKKMKKILFYLPEKIGLRLPPPARWREAVLVVGGA